MATLRLREDVLVWREIEGEVVAVDVTGSAYLAANASGTLLWRMLVEGTTRAELAAALAEAFAIDPGRARADADAFVDSLVHRGLLA